MLTFPTFCVTCMTRPSKTARVQPSLLGDALIDVVDSIRRDVHSALGTRPYRVEIVTRRWSGSTRGEGSYKDEVLVLDPAPHVKRNARDRLGPAGREAAGSLTITGVSLRYTERELQPKADARTEVAYRITEAHGQGQPARYYVLNAPPVPRRGDTPGDATDWYLSLNETTPLSNLEAVITP